MRSLTITPYLNCVAATLQIFHSVASESFKNRWAFGKDMEESMVACFFDSRGHIVETLTARWLLSWVSELGNAWPTVLLPWTNIVTSARRYCDQPCLLVGWFSWLTSWRRGHRCSRRSGNMFANIYGGEACAMPGVHAHRS